ncbi:MAG: alpha/beta fold hydrolase [Deltaproteobacteria bacterium]|nr:alpha/beta fold hydrolase [Deltaproteobacteria bacterium]
MPSLEEEVKGLRKSWHDGVVPEAAPIAYEGGTSAVLLLHGLTSSPAEFRTLAEALHERNFTVCVPLLPGHGTDPHDLRRIKAREWIEAAVSGFDELSKKGKSISVAGFSMGGTLAMYLAATRKVERLLLLAPFIRIYRPPKAWIPPEIKIFTAGYLNRYYCKTRIGGINDLSKLREHFAYYNVPLRALRQALKNVRKVRKLMKEITAPTLILHSKKDETVDSKGSQEIINNISSHEKKVVWFERSNHILTLDYDREDVLSYSIKFLTGLAV